MSEVGQPYTPIGIAEDTLDKTIIINENRQEKAHHHKLNSDLQMKTNQGDAKKFSVCQGFE